MPILTGIGNWSLRNQLLSARSFNGSLQFNPFNLPQFGDVFSFPSSQILTGQGGTGVLTELIRGGLGILSQYLLGRQRLLAGDVVSPVPTEVGALGGVGAIGGLASIAQVIRSAGGIIVGNVIRITRAGWRRIPDWVKAGAAAAGLTVVFDEDEEEEKKKRPRRRGITASELRGFHKLTSLLCRIGMTPRRVCRRRCPR